MNRSSLAIASTTLLVLVGCAADPAREPGPPAVVPPPPAPAAPVAAPPAPPPPAVPRAPIVKRGDLYVGAVVAACPAGTRVTRPEGPATIVDGQLRVSLFFGGCPQWTGYSAVISHHDPAKFYICVDVEHDKCELDGRKTWTFDLPASADRPAPRTAVYAPPIPSDPTPGAQCCCTFTDPAKRPAVQSDSACAANAGRCDDESSCYAVGPTP